RLVPRLRPVGGQLRRERPLRACDADPRRLLLPAQQLRRHARAGPAVAATCRPQIRLHAALPGRRQPAATRRLEPVRARRLRLQLERRAPRPMSSRVTPAMKRALAGGLLLLAALVVLL